MGKFDRTLAYGLADREFFRSVRILDVGAASLLRSVPAGSSSLFDIESNAAAISFSVGESSPVAVIRAALAACILLRLVRWRSRS
jgi:hypothetical protein